MPMIPLTRGYVTVVDDADFEWASARSWCSHFSTGGLVYAVRGATKAEKAAGMPGLLFLHKEIMGVGPDRSVQVDHRNHDGLDNRRANLRVCTPSQNQGNQRKTRGSSRYKGVCWNRRKGKWQAAIALGGRSKHLGYYAASSSSALAYDHAARAQWGDFAHLNFPELAAHLHS